MAPGPNTSQAHPQHKVYPYLLRSVAVVKPNQVWSTDITSAWRAALRTWWPSSTGTPGAC